MANPNCDDEPNTRLRSYGMPKVLCDKIRLLTEHPISWVDRSFVLSYLVLVYIERS